MGDKLIRNPKDVIIEGVDLVADFVGASMGSKGRFIIINDGQKAFATKDGYSIAKEIQPKGLYLTRPSIGQYFTNRKELQAGADQIFEKVKFGKIKIRISKKYKLSEAKNAHTDLEARKLIGPAILIP